MIINFIKPDFGFKIPAIIKPSVDFPTPDFPIIPTICPLFILNETFCNIDFLL